MDNSFDKRIQELQELINNSKKIVFFGGAGVSTESGIPDFRSKDGLYNQKDVQFDKYEPEYLLSDDCLINHPDVFYEFYRQKMDVRNIEPNVTHFKLAELEKAGKLLAVITQNIDDLHQKAGSRNVYEIHGTTRRAYCQSCGTEVNPDYLFVSKDKIPTCGCGGTLRPDVTLYGEMLPAKAFSNSEKALHEADLMIIGGTSLTVFPANTLLQSYYRGNPLVIINRDATSSDRYADIIFHESLGEVFSKIIV